MKETLRRRWIIFTDALMLDIAGFDNGKSLTERAFGNYYIASDKSNPILWLQLEDSDPQQEISYARYCMGMWCF